MKKAHSLFILLIVSNYLYAELPMQSVVPHDEPYYTKTVRNTQLIYTKEGLPYAKEAAEIEMLLQPLYEDKFGYEMDETLHVGLVSQYNQIANGFSTQFPNNRQINYIGGSMLVDYFSSPSWLKTLLYHETAHNYQTNVKESSVSSGIHKYLRNGSLFFPWFTVPNMLESSFLLEGNAVLNESWHGNGGRLYSGRFTAATLQQAKAGYLLPELVYNDNFHFLYGSHFYTLGSRYQYFLGETYGLEKTNDYWKKHSLDWFWPFKTNLASELTFGTDFDTLFNDWRKKMETEAENLVDVEGEAIATSQFYSFINDDPEEIYFIINESGRSFPELVVFNKSSGEISKSKGSYTAGKVLKLDDGRYVTQASAKTSPWRIYQGLYDEDAYIVEGTQSKVIQGYLSDGTEVYFDVVTSYDQPHLYVGDEFYARTNSSIFIDKNDDLYYFIQGEEKERTLYKNKEALFTLQSYYSYVSGVDSKGAVYFISNSPHGSSLFRYLDGKITRAHNADTIFDARLIDDEHAIAVVMGADEYSFKKIELTSIEEKPYEVKLFVENEPYYRKADISTHHAETPVLDLEDDYNALTAMNYSGANISFGNDSESGFVFDLSMSFSDPLTQNAASIFLTRNLDEYTLGGASYANNEFFLQFSLTGYGVINRPDVTPPDTDQRDYGLIAEAYIPFWNAGYNNATLRGGYFEDYESNSRKPLSLALDVSHAEHYGASMFPNYLLFASPYIAEDRGDKISGGEAIFVHDLFSEFYLSLSGQYSSTDADASTDSRGVKLVKSQVDKFEDSDPSTIVMPSLKDTAYFKSVARGSIGLNKVLNMSAYSFSGPVSLRRESLFIKYNYYDIEPFVPGAANEQSNEIVAGLLLDTFWMNKLPIPISLEYIYNDNSLIAEENSFRVGFGFAF